MQSRISDDQLLEIYETRSAPNFPADGIDKAHRLVRLLLAARSWDDVDVFTPVARLGEDRYAVPVRGKWFISFKWSETVGAEDIRLTKL